VKAILFDVDGTLMKAGGAGREALARATAQVLGAPLERVRAAAHEVDFRGRTDEILIEDLCRRVGFATTGLDGRLVGAYLSALTEMLPQAPTELMPGIPQLIELLDARCGIVVGLLTGNIREAARIKLGLFGLGRLADRVGGFGDDARERSEVARTAVRRARDLGISPRHVVVVGDTEHDVTAARAAGTLAVVVATGWTAYAVLAASGADLCLRDLADPRPFLEFIDRVGIDQD